MKKVLNFLFSMAFVLFFQANTVLAQAKNVPIPEGSRSSTTWPWLLAILLSVGIISIGFKNARRMKP